MINIESHRCDSELLKYMERGPKQQPQKVVHTSPNKTLLALQANRRFSCDAIHTRPLSANRVNYISPIVTITSPRNGKFPEPRLTSIRSPVRRQYTTPRMISVESYESRCYDSNRSLTPEGISKSVNSLESGNISASGTADNTSIKSDF